MSKVEDLEKAIKSNCPVLLSDFAIIDGNDLKLNEYAVIPLAAFFSQTYPKGLSKDEYKIKLTGVVLRDIDSLISFFESRDVIPSDDVCTHIDILYANANFFNDCITRYLEEYFASFPERFKSPKIFNQILDKVCSYLFSLDEPISTRVLVEVLLISAIRIGNANILAQDKREDEWFGAMESAKNLALYAQQLLENRERRERVKSELRPRINYILGSMLLDEVKYKRDLTGDKAAKFDVSLKSEAMAYFDTALCQQQMLVVDCGLEPHDVLQLDVARTSVVKTQLLFDDVDKEQDVIEKYTLEGFRLYLSVFKKLKEDGFSRYFKDHCHAIVQALKNIVNLYFVSPLHDNPLAALVSKEILLDDFIDFFQFSYTLVKNAWDSERGVDFAFMVEAAKSIAPSLILSDMGEEEHLNKLLGCFDKHSADFYKYKELSIQYKVGNPLYFDEISILHMAIFMADFDKFSALVNHLCECNLLRDVLSYLPKPKGQAEAQTVLEFITINMSSGDSQRAKCIAFFIAKMHQFAPECFRVNHETRAQLHRKLNDKIMYTIVAHLVQWDDETRKIARTLVANVKLNFSLEKEFLKNEEIVALDPFSKAYEVRNYDLLSQLLEYAPGFLILADKPSVVLTKVVDDVVSGIKGLREYFFLILRLTRLEHKTKVLSQLLDSDKVDSQLLDNFWSVLKANSFEGYNPDQATVVAQLALRQKEVDISILSAILRKCFISRKLSVRLVNAIYARFPLDNIEGYPLSDVFAVDTGDVIYDGASKNWKELLTQLKDNLQLEVTWEKSDRCIKVKAAKAATTIDLPLSVNRQWNEWYPQADCLKMPVNSNELLAYVQCRLSEILSGNVYQEGAFQLKFKNDQLSIVVLVKRFSRNIFAHFAEDVITHFYKQSKFSHVIDFHNNLQNERGAISELTQNYEICCDYMDNKELFNKTRLDLIDRFKKLEQCHLKTEKACQEYEQAKQELTKLQRQLVGPLDRYKKYQERQKKEEAVERKRQERIEASARKKAAAASAREKAVLKREELAAQAAIQQTIRQKSSAYQSKAKILGDFKSQVASQLKVIDTLRQEAFKLLNLHKAKLMKLFKLPQKPEGLVEAKKALDKLGTTDLDTWMSTILDKDLEKLKKMEIHTSLKGDNELNLRRSLAQVNKVQIAVESWKALPQLLDECQQLRALDHSDRFIVDIRCIEKEICRLLVYRNCQLDHYQQVLSREEQDTVSLAAKIAALKNEIEHYARDADVSIEFCRHNDSSASGTDESPLSSPDTSLTNALDNSLVEDQHSLCMPNGVLESPSSEHEPAATPVSTLSTQASSAVVRGSEVYDPVDIRLEVDAQLGDPIDVDLENRQGRLRMMQQLFGFPSFGSPELGIVVSNNHFSFK